MLIDIKEIVKDYQILRAHAYLWQRISVAHNCPHGYYAWSYWDINT